MSIRPAHHKQIKQGSGVTKQMPRFTLDSAPKPGLQFRLPEEEHATAPSPLPELYKPVTAPKWGAGVARETYKRTPKAQPKRTPSRPSEAQMAGGLSTVRAPVGPRKGRRILEFTAADETPMAGLVGTIQLRINRDSCDLGRLENGLLSLAVDHDVSELMGRVVEATIHPAGRLDMLAEISTTETATESMREIDDLTRAGFSPGFLIHETETLSEGDRGYDESEMFQIEVTRFEIYEVSSTAIPRNPNARLRGVASMNSNGTNVGIMDAPEILNREDMIGLSLAAGREVLRSGGGSERQRAKLTEFYKLYDAGLESGLSRDLAATAAKAVAGI